MKDNIKMDLKAVELEGVCRISSFQKRDKRLDVVKRVTSLWILRATETQNILCGQNVEFLHVKPGGT